ncbi:MAG: FapA family protein [Thermoflexaceae bacterium]|nr:FapA family protein [Thermoflexaceae bacterium]
MNGYFQFETQADGLYINIYAPDNGGRAVLMDDVIHYIDKANIGGCDLPSIKTALVSCKDSIKVRVGEPALSSNEWGEYRISTDMLRVEAVFYPGFVGASVLSADEIIRDLSNLGVRHGINEERIKEIAQKKNYFENYVVAEGTPPVDGVDAYITYQFEVEKKAKPKVKEDGSVDFHDLDTLNHVKKGDVLAVMTPEIPGVPGVDVLGRVIQPKKAKRTVFKYGRNMIVSEDGLQLLADVNGHVTLEGDKVFVSNVLEVVNVDASTGDIEYDGNVLITGNVLAGFSVRASGNIEVNGIVEGATVEAGGDLTLIHGVQGMGKAVLKCNGNMVTKFLESARQVVVGGNLETDTILHSKVETRGNINVTGKNGLIVGGDVRSTVLISAKYIGNEMGTATVVGVGVDPSEKHKLENLKKEITALNDTKTKLNQIVTMLRKKQEADGKLDADKLDMLQKSTRNLILTEHDMTVKRNEFNELNNLVSEDSNARIKVSRTIYSGTKLIFGDTYMFVKNKYDYCQFLKSGADIKSIPL